MQENTRMHFYLNWAKERIDEMDAVLGSLQAKAIQVQADSKAKADQLMGDLKKRRDEFHATAEKQAEAGEAAWKRTKAQLETRWNEFEAQVNTYVETVGEQVKQQQTTFRDVAAAQVKAWREAADQLHDEAAKLAAARRSDIDAAVSQMKADASEAEARLQKLKEAGGESWTALGAALAESRKAFDHANQIAWDALKRAAPLTR
jgi:DNA anti-recombination protein RmuC